MSDNENICDKKVYLSYLAGEPLISYLKMSGFSPVLLDGTRSPVYTEVSAHADIHMCRLGLWDEPELFIGNTSKLGRNYPGNIIYNAVCTGKYFIHNLKYTDPELLRAACSRSNDKLIKIHVPQGYTRCCCLPVDDSSFITSDAGIAGALQKAGAHIIQSDDYIPRGSHTPGAGSHIVRSGNCVPEICASDPHCAGDSCFSDIEVLLISKGSIALPGFDCGFIGGCAGHIKVNDKSTIVFNGNLSAHPDYKKIAAFIHDRDIDIRFFEDYPLTDIGSILTGSLFNG